MLQNKTRGYSHPSEPRAEKGIFAVKQWAEIYTGSHLHWRKLCLKCVLRELSLETGEQLPFL